MNGKSLKNFWNSRIFIFKGFGGRSEDDFFNDVWIFDTTTQQWSLVNAESSADGRPPPRASQSVVWPFHIFFFFFFFFFNND